MLYKNLIRFANTDPALFAVTLEQLNQALSDKRLQPCAAEESHAIGAVPLYPDNLDKFALQIGGGIASGALVFKVRIENKSIPKAAMDDAIGRLISAVEASGQTVDKRHRAELKEAALADLTARALVDASVVWCWFDALGLWVDTASTAKAESIASYLRKCLGALPVVPFIREAKHTPQNLYTAWIRFPPEDYEVGEDFVLYSPEEGGAVIRCKGQAADSDEVLAHLDAGKMVSEISLTWRGRVSFRLDKNLTLKSIKFIGLSPDDADYEDEAAKLLAEAMLNIEEITGLTVSLKSLLN